MKSFLKRVVMALYNWGLISGHAVQRAFECFDLRSA
jgi:hypothetical protein